MSCETAQRMMALRAMALADEAPESLFAGHTGAFPDTLPETFSPEFRHALRDEFRTLDLESQDLDTRDLDTRDLDTLDLDRFLREEAPDEAAEPASWAASPAASPIPRTHPADGPAAAHSAVPDSIAHDNASPDSTGDESTGHDALDEHLRACRACQAEMAATIAFFRALAGGDAGPEPSATLLARARMQLDASLDCCEHAGLLTRLGRRFSFSLGRLRAAPALSSALLLVGVLAGAYGGYRAGLAAHNDEQTTLLLAPPPTGAPSIVADVSSIERDPDSGLVQVRYDRLVPDTLTAPAGSASLRELLMAGAENGVDPTVRDASLSLLSGQCSGDGDCSQAPVRSALLNALSNDKAPEVRREALAGLQPFIADDITVRDAVLAALLNDPSASVRIEAVRLLQPVDVDSSVRQVLHTVAASDGDPTIRSASLQVLRAMPTLQ